MTLRILAVASEMFPLVKTGGLADVVGALPGALAAQGIAVTTLLPGYPAVLAALPGAKRLHAIPRLFGGPARLLHGRAGGLDVVALDAPHLFGRAGNPYSAPDGRDWPDNASRFAGLSRAAASLARGEAGLPRFAAVHAHDWQAGLVAAYLHYGGGPKSVFTIHNMAFPGWFPAGVFPGLGLPEAAWDIEGVEYHGGVGLLKAGVALADALTTVSPTYAAEIRTDAGGMGLGGLLRLRADRLHGILNGIDTTVWNPAADPHLPRPYDVGRLSGRSAAKAALQSRLGLAPEPASLLFGIVSRLTGQKGMDLVLDALPALLGQGARLAVLGSGDRVLEAGFAAAASVHAGRVGCVIGYDEGLAHLVQAGADALLVPSRFEPCGLTQLCALRYGALPVVARVGGLADTVVDANEAALAAGAGTGLVFAPPDQDALEAALLRAAALWRDPKMWRKLQRNAMRSDVSWARPAGRYAALFRSLATP
jgi:starch synthase